MSLLNLTNDGLPNVLVILYEAVARARSPLTRENLLDAVAPSGVVIDEGKMARQTLNRWRDLGLFVEKDNVITLAATPLSNLRGAGDLLASVRREARRCALSEPNNENLWASEGAKAADFTRSLAWLLAQDVYRTKFTDLEELEGRQIADQQARLMRNDTRRNGLQFWAHFLGFVRQPGGGEIDPTVAVRDILPECLQPGEDMPASDFVDKLAVALPVLDRGVWRKAVEARLEPQALPTLEEGQLSTSLSRALLSLMMAEELQFENRADVGRGVVFTGRDGLRPNYRYSWVKRTHFAKGRAG
ncbi:MAG: protein DpdG [Casimicrobiaceae bacterium]